MKTTSVRIYNQSTCEYHYSAYIWDNNNQLVDHHAFTESNTEIAFEMFCGEPHIVVRDITTKCWVHDFGRNRTEQLIIIK